jgi:hypothetical protein
MPFEELTDNPTISCQHHPSQDTPHIHEAEAQPMGFLDFLLRGTRLTSPLLPLAGCGHSAIEDFLAVPSKEGYRLRGKPVVAKLGFPKLGFQRAQQILE